jgi:hypothetical protein
MQPLNRYEEEAMKRMIETKAQQAGWVVLLVFLLVCAVTPAMMAKDKPTEQVSVIAHLSLPGTPVSKMFLQEESGRQYLYVQQPSKDGFTVVDVTKPNKPNIVKRAAFPNAATNGSLQMVGSGIAIAETPDKDTQASDTSAQKAPASSTGKAQATAKARVPETIRVLDVSDPQNPKTLRTFEKVSSILSDGGRHLIYITNDEGLWILRHHEEKPTHLCDSEEVFSPIANCD